MHTDPRDVNNFIKHWKCPQCRQHPKIKSPFFFLFSFFFFAKTDFGNKKKQQHFFTKEALGQTNKHFLTIVRK